jgi:hypothetical protein
MALCLLNASLTPLISWLVLVTKNMSLDSIKDIYGGKCAV